MLVPRRVIEIGFILQNPRAEKRKISKLKPRSGAREGWQLNLVETFRMNSKALKQYLWRDMMIFLAEKNMGGFFLGEICKRW